MSAKKAAPRPTPRTVHIALEGPFAGWEATLRTDFPLRILSELSSDDVTTITGALDRLVVEHNFPDSKDNVAASMLDVDPSDAVNLLAEQFVSELGRLPPR